MASKELGVVPGAKSSLPPQITQTTVFGKETPGVLPRGKMSDFVQGMIVSIEQKTSLLGGVNGTKKKSAESARENDDVSASNFKKINMFETTNPKSKNRKGLKRYKILKLVPYENEEIGIGENKVRKTTTVFDEYFLMEST